MDLTNNTVLISGGSAGIGFEIARLLTEKGNHVIITGRDEQRLSAAAAKLNNVTAIAVDVTKEDEVDQLVKRLGTDFPELNILINNAGAAHYYNLIAGDRTWEKADEEMDTNYISIIRLTEKLLPALQQQKTSAIVNVSSIAALAPNLKIATYSASKAALHSYTQSLRLALQDTGIKVFELMPPLVNTDFSASIGGKENGISPVEVANDLLKAFDDETFEIHVGQTAAIFELTKVSPLAALNAMNAR